MKRWMRYIVMGAALAISAVAVSDFGQMMSDMKQDTTPAESVEAEQPATERIRLERVEFDNLGEFDFAQTNGMVTTYGRVETRGFMDAFLKSCESILKMDPEAAYGPNLLKSTVADWQAPCRDLTEGLDENWLGGYFNLYRVYDGTEDEGLFTGYYEPLLRGSFEQTDTYNVPLYAVPNDMMKIDLGRFSEDYEGETVRARIDEEGNVVPYFNRADIDGGALDSENAEVLIWVDDAVDAFFLQIQGSGVVSLEDGTRVRIGYADQNGRPYFAIGRELIERGVLTRENVSLQTIRAWLNENPQEASAVMQMNPSYVFFRILEDVDGPLGAQGVSLTPEYSLAVDRTLYAYGMPVLIEAEDPLRPATRKFRRLMVAQDTGGAIRGPVRGDVFWGAGERAERKAGQMKSRGRMWVFLPKTLNVPNRMRTGE